MPYYDADGNEVDPGEDIKRLRSQAETLEAELKEAKKEAKDAPLLREQVETFKAKERKQAVEAIVTSEDIGGKPGWANLIPQEVEPTPEAIGAWLQANDLVSPAPALETSQQAPSPPQAWSPTVGGSPSGGPQPMTAAEYTQLLRDNPAEARRAVETRRYVPDLTYFGR